MSQKELLQSKERFPASVSVGLLLTHGRSGRLLMVRHGVKSGEKEQWGIVAGGVKKDEDPWSVMTREANEEAHVKSENIIFERNRDSLKPHAAMLHSKNKISVGLVYSATYSGPKVSSEEWEVHGDKKVDFARFFTWQEVLGLMENPENIYRNDFNFHQLLRWSLDNRWRSEKRRRVLDVWLYDRVGEIDGLEQDGESGWRYTPPYNSWMNAHGFPEKTNFARSRFLNMSES